MPAVGFGEACLLVIACDNYNATNSVNNYQACMTALQDPNCPVNYAGAPPPACAAAALGRSLEVATPVPPYDGCAAAFAQWVQGSLTLATDEAPKFALRAQFLNDIYTKAAIMPGIFSQGAAAIQSFVSGPAAQLASVQAQGSPAQNLPNSVIYGWQDNLPSGGAGGCLSSTGQKVGCSHLVKVTAYSTARCGGVCLSGGIDSLLPWIKTKTSGFLGTTRSYTLTDRDGYVYVSVKRWDQSHSDPINYPNGRPLWQFLFQNPTGGGGIPGGQGIVASCVGLPLPTSQPIGFGLTPATLTGLGYYGGLGKLLPQDVTALSSAFYVK